MKREMSAWVRVELFMCLKELKICCRESYKFNPLFHHEIRMWDPSQVGDVTKSCKLILSTTERWALVICIRGVWHLPAHSYFRSKTNIQFSLSRRHLSSCLSRIFQIHLLILIFNIVPNHGQFLGANQFLMRSPTPQRIFTPPAPSSKPTKLFSIQINNYSSPAYRFVCTTDSEQILMFIDGSSLGNRLRLVNAHAGYAVIFSPVQWFHPIYNCLEQDSYPQTSNRAELRDVLDVLGLPVWIGEGFKKIVTACDSQYVVNSILAWILKWRRNGWKSNTGATVANQDLWKKVEQKLREMEKERMLVQFWWIPRGWNEADSYVRESWCCGSFIFKIIGLALTVVRLVTRMRTLLLGISWSCSGCHNR